MPRGRKKKFKLNLNIRSDTLRSMLSVFLVVLGLVVLISFIFSSYSANAWLQQVLRFAFGSSHIILAPVLVVTGLLLMGLKWRFIDVRALIGLVLFLLSLSGFSHVFYFDEGLSFAQEGRVGGVAGYYIVFGLSSLLSIYGAGITLFGGILVAIMLFFDKTIVEMGSVFGTIFQKTNETLGLSAFFERKSSEDADIEISEGINSESHEDEDQTIDDTTHEIDKPSFEIIPTVAEPQASHASSFVPNSNDAQNITTLSPALPYADRVWELPPLSILNDPPTEKPSTGNETENKRIIQETLESFGIKATVSDVNSGPTVTRYALKAESGTRINKIANLQYDLALALASPTGSVRIEAPIPGKSLVGIEVPNERRINVTFKELLVSEQMKALKSKVGVVLGLDVGGMAMVYDINKMPHMLIAGATGSGKSVFIHSIMASILFRASPEEVKFILIDPKRVELVHYNDIPHLSYPVITDIEKAPSAFQWLVQEMDRRYKLLEKARVRNIEGYNEKSGFQALPYIVVIVDEFAEIMIVDPAGVEKSIIRLSQLARAVGIHLILALQRPTTNIVTGLIKANVPCRVAFNVTSQIDSRVIIDQPGAEKLLGKGDMLFVPPTDSKPVRSQGAYLSDDELNGLVSYLKGTGVAPKYEEDILSQPVQSTRSSGGGDDDVDPLYREAADLIISEGKGSASLLQRRLSIGYSRAARILDELEARGIVGPQEGGSKPRKVLVDGLPTSNISGFSPADNVDLSDSKDSSDDDPYAGL